MTAKQIPPNYEPGEKVFVETKQGSFIAVINCKIPPHTKVTDVDGYKKIFGLGVLQTRHKPKSKFLRYVVEVQNSETYYKLIHFYNIHGKKNE